MLAQRAKVAPHVVPPRPSYWRSKFCIASRQADRRASPSGTRQLFSVPFREYERQLRQQFADMFSGSGFNPKTDIANHSQSLGKRVLNSATRIFLWQRWTACAGGSLAGSPV